MASTAELFAFPAASAMREYRVDCEIEAHDGAHVLSLIVLAADEDDAGDAALALLDSACITGVSRVARN